jgi:hypothetical protein
LSALVSFLRVQSRSTCKHRWLEINLPLLFLPLLLPALPPLRLLPPVLLLVLLLPLLGWLRRLLSSNLP